MTGKKIQLMTSRLPVVSLFMWVLNVGWLGCLVAVLVLLVGWLVGLAGLVAVDGICIGMGMGIGIGMGVVIGIGTNQPTKQPRQPTNT
jgi:hypothetical protein